MKNRRDALKNRVAVVTGAGQGMGAAIAERLAESGASVVVADLDGNKAQAVAERLKNTPGPTMAVRADVTQEQDVSQLLRVAADAYGTVGILVNNAGVLRATAIEDISLDEWRWVMEVNVTGTFLCSRAALHGMKQQGFGRIVNMSSSAGRSVSTLGGAHYTTAKAAVLGFTRALAKETARFGITVNAVCPGLIDTDMVRQNCTPERVRAYEESFPIQRLGTPEEVADLVLYLADAAYVTGASIDINGGDLMM